jgi:transcriptional regulator NrdR family protein
MKILMKCPNCRSEKSLNLDHTMTSERLKVLFKNSGVYCEKCSKDGLGKIQLKVKSFDWEKKVETTRLEQELHTPVHLDPSSISKEQLEKNIKKVLSDLVS